MLEVFTWLVTGVSIIGVILNAQKKVSGFYFWIVANSCWIFIDVQEGIYAQACLFAFYLVMCFYGIYMWRNKGE